MKTTELRIGNYLNYYGEDVIVLELLRNDDAEFGYFTDSVGFNRKLTEKHSPKPIPLTEEWLFKFGFEKVNGWDDFKGWIKNDVELECDAYGCDFINCIDKEVKYVHQLQNLYFSLTQEELVYEI